MLLLFDIDGTLLSGMPPAHRQALCDAARIVYNVDLAPADLGNTAGMIDSAIARRVLAESGVPLAKIDAGLPRFFAVAGDAYQRHVPRNLRPFLIEHVVDTLTWLRERKISLGLVTGNIQRIGWAKLSAAGLAEYFGCGAFGDDAETRAELPPLAVLRAAQRFDRPFAREDVYVIGDTPADISCGSASFYHTVGVATGPEHSLEHLRACGAEYICSDLRGLRAIVASSS